MENELIKSAQTGDIQAFETLVRKYQRRVTGLAATIVCSRSDALDVAQETFIRVYRFLIPESSVQYGLFLIKEAKINIKLNKKALHQIVQGLLFSNILML